MVQVRPTCVLVTDQGCDPCTCAPIAGDEHVGSQQEAMSRNRGFTP